MLQVLRRVAEMQELVQNSEQYLTQQQQQHQHPGQVHHQQPGKEESDSEGSHISSLDSDAPGQLKHSDSLLLLTQVSETANYTTACINHRIAFSKFSCS
jgi:hypothetical protein